MVAETMMFKLSGAAQAAQVPMLAGQSFTVGSTVATGDGMANWIFLHPLGGGGAGGNSMVALKLEGARQSGQLSALVGKCVTVGKAPVGTASAGKWLVLHPGVSGMAAKGVGGGVAMQQMGFEIEGAAAQKGVASGVAKGATGNTLVGKGVGSGLVGKGLAGGTKSAMAGSGVVAGPATAVGAKAAMGAKGIAAGGTIWTGSGTSLGLGLGLGALGPVLLVGVVAAVGVGIYSYMKRSAEESELEDAVS